MPAACWSRRYVELAIAVALLIVIIFHTKAHEKAWHWLQQRQRSVSNAPPDRCQAAGNGAANAQIADCEASNRFAASADGRMLAKADSARNIYGPTAGAVKAPATPDGSAAGDIAPAGSYDATPCNASETQGAGMQSCSALAALGLQSESCREPRGALGGSKTPPEHSNDGRQSLPGGGAPVGAAVVPAEPQHVDPPVSTSDQPGDDAARLLGSWPLGSSAAGPSGAASRAGDSAAVGDRIAAWWQRLRQRSKDPAVVRGWTRLFGFGALAGFIAGVMGSLTGMGGPPVMLLYELLKVPKEIVRGTNAMLNVLQFRILVYAGMGMFKWSDAGLYGATSAGSLVGLAIGNALAARIDQQAFSRMMVALMLVCCVLMFASAAGVGGE